MHSTGLFTQPVTTHQIPGHALAEGYRGRGPKERPRGGQLPYLVYRVVYRKRSAVPFALFQLDQCAS